MRTLKITFLFIQIFAVSLSAFAQEYFYYYKGEKQPLQLNTEFIYVVTAANISDSVQLSAVLDKSMAVSRFSQENAAKTLNAVGQSTAQSSSWAEVRLQARLNPSAYLSYLQQLKANRAIQLVAPYFKNEKENKIGLSQYFYVKLKNKNDFMLLEKMASETNTTIVGQNKFMPLWYTLKCTDKSTENALQIANRFYESKLFQYAEPDLMVDDEIHAVNDPQFASQWGLNNTGLYGGTAGLDINGLGAWEITKGSRDIIVAVLDHGFEMNHPDLKANTYGTGFDTESGTTPAKVLGSHATACAGIIAATQDNNQGVSGVAPNVRLMSVSNSLLGNPTSRQKRADGINWAWQHGAHIISNSWGSGVAYAIIDDAIDNALTNGRGGLGTLIVFSSGNNNGSVSYPANSNPDIITVGAMSECGQRKSPTSCDGESWGSNYGAQLDVVAPGVLIATTDRQGSSGYNNGSAIHPGNGGSWVTTDFADKNYTVWFNGTSSACPMVAGVAALVLSVNPCLTHDQVENIIEQSAQKVGGYSYNLTLGRPNGGWNNQMGYGLVDAEAAVQMAQEMLPTAKGFDLFSKDRPFDTGAEPNPDSGPMYITEDIWVRKSLDGGSSHQNPEYNPYAPNGIYIKVTNRGRQSSTCANLSLYFSKASTGLVWPTHWSDYFQTTSAGNILHGDKVNTVLIPALGPGASYTVEIPWFPPNPADFDNDIHHFCLLSRIESPSDPMFDEQNMVGVGTNVRKNNNIVWKNVSVYNDETDGEDGASIFVRGIARKISYINLQFIDKGFNERVRIKFFGRSGKILVHADPEFIARMKEAGTAGIKIIDKESFLVRSRKGQISRFPISPKETFSLNMKFSVQLSGEEETLLDVVQRNAETNEIEGGERFIIRNAKQQAMPDKEISVEKVNAIVYPNPVNAELFIKYDVDADNSDVEVSIHNVLSMQKVNLFTGKKKAGEYQDSFNTQNLKKGIYVLTLKIGDQVKTETVIIE